MQCSWTSPQTVTGQAKNMQPDRGLNPEPLAYRASALLTELSGPLTLFTYAHQVPVHSGSTRFTDHLLWYKDGRFAHHYYFKCVGHNMIIQKSATDNGRFIVNQKLGDCQLTEADVKKNWSTLFRQNSFYFNG